jgi:hypothetical protein
VHVAEGVGGKMVLVGMRVGVDLVGESDCGTARTVPVARRQEKITTESVFIMPK